MWPFDYFSKKPSISKPIEPQVQEHGHVYVQLPQHTPALPAPVTMPHRAHGKLRRYLIDPVPSKSKKASEYDKAMPGMAADFLVGELLGLAAPSTDAISSGPIEDTSTTPEFQGFGGGTSGGGGSSGQWDGPSDTSSVDSGDSGSSGSDSSGS